MGLASNIGRPLIGCFNQVKRPLQARQSTAPRVAVMVLSRGMRAVQQALTAPVRTQARALVAAFVSLNDFGGDHTGKFREIPHQFGRKISSPDRFKTLKLHQ